MCHIYTACNPEDEGKNATSRRVRKPNFSKMCSIRALDVEVDDMACLQPRSFEYLSRRVIISVPYPRPSCTCAIVYTCVI